MLWSLKLFRLFGVPVYLHWTFLLMVAAFAWFGLLSILLMLFSIVILHEFGHILMARRYGIPCSGVVLLPIGGIAGLNDVPPEHEFMITLAGPLVNVVLAVLAFIPYVLLCSIGHISEFLVMYVIFNVILFIFNMLPVYPMDGGRIMRSTLHRFTTHKNATWWAVRIGQVTACLMIVASFFLTSPMIGGIMGLMIFVSQRELKRACQVCGGVVEYDSPRYDVCCVCCDKLREARNAE